MGIIMELDMELELVMELVKQLVMGSCMRFIIGWFMCLVMGFVTLSYHTDQLSQLPPSLKWHWFLEVINRFLEVINRFLKVINRFLEVITT